MYTDTRVNKEINEWKTQTVVRNELLTSFSINSHREGCYITTTHCTYTIPKPFPVWNNVNKELGEL